MQEGEGSSGFPLQSVAGEAGVGDPVWPRGAAIPLGTGGRSGPDPGGAGSDGHGACLITEVSVL
jgi:hypothetical protein